MNRRRRDLLSTVLPAITALMLLGAPLLLFGAGFLAGRVTAPASDVTQPAAVRKEFDVFWEVWNLAEEKFVVPSALDTQKMVYGAISGMLESLNDEGHTRFLTPSDAKVEADMLHGEFVGIGIEVSFKDGRPVVVAPLHGEPAEQVGVRAGDVIMEVDGHDTAHLTMTEVSQLIRGQENTSVRLTILHADERQVVVLTVMRKTIKVPSVLSNAFSVNGHRVAHIQITQFGDHVDDQLRTVLQGLQKGGLDGVILDLRNNPGGLRDQAVAVTSEFLDHGNVLVQQDRAGHREDFPVKAGGVALRVPLEVLVDRGTASSAEIVAGALQDAHRGTLIGATTFGTGTVLQQFRLSDGSVVLLGVEQWLTPAGHEIWHHGITPDIVVSEPAGVRVLTPDREGGLSESDELNNSDAQFARALKELLGNLDH
jgi:carboxyl-terminal processing protease